MRPMRILAVLLALVLLFPTLAAGTATGSPLGFQVTVSPSDAVAPGGQVDVTISLTGYTPTVQADDAIRGIQVDITGVDSTLLSVADKKTLVTQDNCSEDADALSNKASFNASKQRVRLLFALSEGTLHATQKELLHVSFRVSDSLTGSGSITLPVAVRIQTQKEQLTLHDAFTIRYTADAGSETPATSVEVSWGAMTFEYTHGTWNPETHRYEGAGWTDSGTGYVTVTNKGTAQATAAFTYTTDRTDISGSFVHEEITDTGETLDQPISSAQAIPSGEAFTAHLRLSGKPAEELSNVTIGTVTVTIGGE